jgi:hypothetical protein
MLPATRDPSLQPLRARNRKKEVVSGRVWRQAQQLCAPQWLGASVWGSGGCWLRRKEVQVWSLGWNMMLGVRVSTHNWESSPPSEQPTLRKTATLQGVPPSCCGRRVAVWSGVCSSRPSTGCGEAARRAISLRTWGLRARRSPCPPCPTTQPPYVPRPSAVDHLGATCWNPTPDLLSHCHRRVYGVRGALVDR